MKDREEYISILEQDNVELKKQVDELNRFKFSCKKDETRIPATIYSKKTVEDLIKGNQELKKQLEERTKMYQNAYDYSQKMEGKAIILETQQKEFIKWLENYLEIFDCDNIDEQVGYDMIEGILQKYKEIIGRNDV